MGQGAPVRQYGLQGRDVTDGASTTLSDPLTRAEGGSQLLLENSAYLTRMFERLSRSTNPSDDGVLVKLEKSNRFIRWMS
jgi:hypothetical protein